MQQNLYIANIIYILILFINLFLMQFKRICEEIYLTILSRRKKNCFVEKILTKSFKKVLLVCSKTKS
jgi:hypothetical protein